MAIRRTRVVLGGMLLFALATAADAATQWVQTWGASPLPPTAAFGPFPATPSFNNQTLRETVRVSAGGRRIRIRFTNEYGAQPLVIGAARVALADEKGNIQPGSDHPILFSGKSSVTIPAAAPFVSDPIDLPVKALSSLSISLYLPQETGQCTCHQVGVQNAFVSGTGDFTDRAFEPQQTLQMRAFIAGVAVETAASTRAVVVLGDSISDGVGSTVDANHRWPDLLADRLDAKGSNAWGVVNMGISGNRILGDGAGQSALARFDRDVLSTPGVKVVIVFEGVNDIGISYGTPQGPLADRFKALAPAHKVTSDDLIAGYRQLIARAHSRGLRIVGATITPYGGAMYYAAEGESVRQVVNHWILTSHEFDGVIDFDAAIRDPNDPTRIKEGFHAGDHLHGSDAGYVAMAAAIQLSLLK